MDEEENIDAEVVRYVRSLRPRRRLLGIDAVDLWTIILNIQKYYEERDAGRRARALAETETLKQQLRDRDRELYRTRKALERTLIRLKEAEHGEKERAPESPADQKAGR